MSDPAAKRANLSSSERPNSATVEPRELAIDVRDDEPVVDLRTVEHGTWGDPVRQAVAPEVPDRLVRRRVFGFDFVDAPSLEPVVDALIQRQYPANAGHVSTVLTPNVDIMVQLEDGSTASRRVWRMLQSSQFCLPDGQPIVLASRILRRPLQARLTGSGLFAELWPRLVEENRSVHVIATSEDVAAGLRGEYGHVVTTVPPMFDVDDQAAMDQIAKAVVTGAAVSVPEFVFVGVGHPKDVLLAETILQAWPESSGRAPTVLACGGAASMYVGITKRAPQWVQRIGMEWFYRFVQEPRRLFHRYFVRDVAFVGLVGREWRSQRKLVDAGQEG